MGRVRKKISSMSELDSTVTRLMQKHFPHLVNNKDATDIGSSAILKADWTFNGSGNLGGFRSFVFRRDIRDYLKSDTPLERIPEDYAVSIDFDFDLFEACEKILPPGLYKIVYGYFKRGLTYSQLAEELDVSESTIPDRLNKALDTLFDRLEN
jgi:RNA polymerase sigma factor (sigma-70 family)